MAATKYMDSMFLELSHMSLTPIENLSCWYGTQTYPDFFVFFFNIETESCPYLIFHNFLFITTNERTADSYLTPKCFGDIVPS